MPEISNFKSSRFLHLLSFSINCQIEIEADKNISSIVSWMYQTGKFHITNTLRTFLTDINNLNLRNRVASLKTTKQIVVIKTTLPSNIALEVA